MVGTATVMPILNVYWVISGLSVVLFGLICFALGTLSIRPMRRAVHRLASSMEANRRADQALLASFLTCFESSQRTAMLRIEEKIDRGIQNNHAISKRLSSYIDHLKNRQIIDQDGVEGLLDLLCDALRYEAELLWLRDEVDGDQTISFVREGKCVVCGSDNPALSEHPTSIPSLHDPRCPVARLSGIAADKLRLATKISEVKGTGLRAAKIKN
jgi:hypothetical protein